jgi:hypothetical protein
MEHTKPIGRAACAAVATACSATGAANAATVRVDSDLTEPVEYSQLTVLVHPELHRPETALLTWGVAGGGTDEGQNSQTLEIDFELEPDEFFVMGLTQSDAVVLSFADPTVAAGQTFETLFPGFDQPSVAAMLRADDPKLSDFINAIKDRDGIGAKLGATASAIEFGAGAPVGTFAVSIVPAPGPLLALLVAGPLAARRRRSV